MSLVIIILIVAVFMFLPSKWFERMATISTYELDQSARQRLDSWYFSYQMAKANFLGGGFECFTPEQYLKHASDPELNIRKNEYGDLVAHTAHSIYFEVLAEHGFIGLIIYMACLISILYSLVKINWMYSAKPEFKWISAFSNAFIVSIIGFMISAAFVSRAFFELFWVIWAAAICFVCITEREGLEIEKRNKKVQKAKIKPAVEMQVDK